MASFHVIIIVFSLVLVGVVGWVVIKLMGRLERHYRLALEYNQKMLDRQTSRINILTRALPHIQTQLMGPQDQGTWKQVCLEEARALLWAESASYWVYNEKTDSLELELSKETDRSPQQNDRERKVEEKHWKEFAEKRIPLQFDSDGESVVLLPLTISHRFQGGFRFSRKQAPKFSQPDLEVGHMFFRQLEIALENRELVVNREKFYLELVQTLADTLDSRDTYSEGQSRRARDLARGVGHELDMPDEFIYYLEFAALLHDVGKMAIDDSVLKKPGKLTDAEFELVKKHPEYGHKILSPVTMLAPVAPMVLYHQEWFNGKGYPEGLSGEEIPLGARIVAILDAWGAMTNHRPWRKAMSVEDGLIQLRKGAGSQFDPQVVEAFVGTLQKQGYVKKTRPGY